MTTKTRLRRVFLYKPHFQRVYPKNQRFMKMSALEKKALF
jgi:hypothetical protein